MIIKFKTLSILIGLLVLAGCYTLGISQSIPKKHRHFTKEKEIRQFDFLNAKYAGGNTGKMIKVKNGEGETETSVFHVEVSFGDLTGDGVEEAVVVTKEDGAVQSSTEGTIYAIRRHHLLTPAKLEPGARNTGYIHSAKVKNGLLVVTRGLDMERPSDCEEAEVTAYKLRGKTLIRVRKTVCVPL